MAIPTWTWTGRNGADGGTETATALEIDPDETDVSRAAGEFELLASPVRLEILLALAERGPLRYTDLRAATSIDDNGRLNYHLRTLEPYVSRGGDGDASDDGSGYELTPRGRRLLDRLS